MFLVRQNTGQKNHYWIICFAICSSTLRIFCWSNNKKSVIYWNQDGACIHLSKKSTSSNISNCQWLSVYYQPETITELVRKQKEHQIKKEVIEESDITDSAVPQSQDASEIEEITKPSTVIANPLTPPTPDPLTKDKTHIKVEALPVSSCGMMDRTRVALFAFMFTFLFINPLSYVIPQLDKGN